MKSVVPFNVIALSPNLPLEKSNELNDFFQTARKAYGDKQAVELSRNFCLSSTSPHIWRVGMEFLYMNGYFNELKEMAVKNKQSIYPVNRQWGTIYQLQLDRLAGSQPACKLVQALNEFQPELPELKALKGFLEIWICYDINEIERLGGLLTKQSEYIAEVVDPMLASLFSTRLYEAQAVYYWKRNELVLARKYAFDALKSIYSQSRKAIIHDRLALSYIFDDYVHATTHMKEALRVAEMYDNRQLYYGIKHTTLPFILACFGHAEHVKTDDRAEQAHLEIVKGNLEEAKAILATLPLDTPLQKYYMGLASENKVWLMESYNDFIGKSSDYFFSRLPLHALRKDSLY